MAVERADLTGYPVNLLITGRRCVVVGAGRIAARKIEALLDAGGDVHVIAPEVVDEIEGWATAGRLTLSRREFAATDLDNAWLATAATSTAAVNRAVAEAGAARRVWVNAVDDPAHCTFTLMSVVRQGDIVVTVGTGGRSPALATFLKSRIANEMGPEWAELLELLSEARENLRAEGTSSEDVDWRQALDSGMIDLVRAGKITEAKELLDQCLSSSSD